MLVGLSGTGTEFSSEDETDVPATDEASFGRHRRTSSKGTRCGGADDAGSWFLASTDLERILDSSACRCCRFLSPVRRLTTGGGRLDLLGTPLASNEAGADETATKSPASSSPSSNEEELHVNDS